MNKVKTDIATKERPSENGQNAVDPKILYVAHWSILDFDPECYKKFNHDLYIPDVVMNQIKGNSKSKDPRQVERASDFINGFSSLLSSDNESFEKFLQISLPEKNNSVYLGKVSDYNLPKDRKFNTEDLHDQDNKFIEEVLKIDLLIRQKETFAKKNHVAKFKDEFEFAKKYDKVVIVSKDASLNIKANRQGLSFENYRSQDVESEKLPLGYVEVVLSDGKLPHTLFGENKKDVHIDEIPEIQELGLTSNTFITVTDNDQKAVILFYYHHNKTVSRLLSSLEHKIFGIKPRNKEQLMAMHLLLDDRIKVATLRGSAGTGKTLIALACALHQKHKYKQILCARPIVIMGNDIGFLPGTKEEKYDPFLQPFYDNLKVISENSLEEDQQSKVPFILKKMQEDGKISYELLGHIRGRSIIRVFLLIDEAQNLTPHEIKTIVSRAGEGVKIVFTGDTAQIDSPYLTENSNGVSHLTKNFEEVKFFATMKLTATERSEIAEEASKRL